MQASNMPNTRAETVMHLASQAEELCDHLREHFGIVAGFADDADFQEEWDDSDVRRLKRRLAVLKRLARDEGLA